MAYTKTDFSDILRTTAHRRMGNDSYFEHDKNAPPGRSGLNQERSYNTSVENAVVNVLEEALFKYDDRNTSEKEILQILSEYDNKGSRQRMYELRDKIRELQDRINAGQDHSTMRMILRTIVRSKRRELDKSAGSPPGTPQTSDDEEEDDFQFVHEQIASPTSTPLTSDDEGKDIVCKRPAPSFSQLHSTNSVSNSASYFPPYISHKIDDQDETQFVCAFPALPTSTPPSSDDEVEDGSDNSEGASSLGRLTHTESMFTLGESHVECSIIKKKKK